jgi:biotin carboxylase
LKKILLLCPTERERRELPRIADQLDCEIIYDTFDDDYFDKFLGENPDLGQPTLKIVDLIEQTVEKYRDANLDGVTSAIGYPGMSAASVIASKLGLPGPSPESIMLCEHKYYSRVYQQLLVPEATPKFHLIDPIDSATYNGGIDYPSFLKPVKSCMSKNSNGVASHEELLQLIKVSLLPDQFIEPFNDMMHAYTHFEQHATCLLHEELLSGVQVSMEGYVFNKEVHVMGVIDAIMFPGTRSFSRWQYPSRLSQTVLDRMSKIATRFFAGIEYDNALFNMEFFYNHETDAISIIEINPKIASQFPNLFLKVDGFSTYRTLLEVAMGLHPQTGQRNGKYVIAANCVLRTFEDQIVHRIPEEKQIDSVESRFENSVVQIYATPGKKLSDLVQDTQSYRYGLIDLGATNETELESNFEICKQMLQFEFEPVNKPVLA